MKICSKCDIEKELIYFYKDKSHLDGLTSSCKSCYKEYKNKSKNVQQKWNKENYLKNKDHIKLSNKEYYNDNKEAHFNRMRIWNENNKSHLELYRSKNKEKINSIIRNKYQNDSEFRLKILLRNRLVELLRRNKSEKSISSLILMGCETKELKSYIESLFFPEMNWKNHGIIWEIDHIIPCLKFDLTKLEEQQKCFHYTNLQPLFKTTKIAQEYGYDNIIGNRNKPKYL